MNTLCNNFPNKVQLSLAAYPGLSFGEALVTAHSTPPSEPLWGPLSMEQVQLCPQNAGHLSEDLVWQLREDFSEPRFRLHANVRVLPNRQVADLADWSDSQTYFSALAKVSHMLGATGYSAHAGSREHTTLQRLIEYAKAANDLFDCPVGIEGHYPTLNNRYLVDSWSEYQAVFESGVPYAVDLSHLNILVSRTHRREDGLVAEMLNCERCMEVHVSDNDGVGDTHQTLNVAPWWYPLMRHVHPEAVIFSEGNQRRKAVPRQGRQPNDEQAH